MTPSSTRWPPGSAASAFEDITVSGVRLRLYAFHGVLRDINAPVAVVLARPLSPVDSVLSHLRLILLLLAAAGVALAAALGRLAADRVLAPLAEVAETAQHVSETEDLDEPHPRPRRGRGRPAGDAL